MHILIVNHDPYVTDRYAQALRGAGYGVSVCHDGEAALAEISRGGYDLVFIDVVLPGRDGFGVLGALERRGAAHPPIVLLTNLGRREDVERGFLLGAVDYLVKARAAPADLVLKAEQVLGRAVLKETH